MFDPHDSAYAVNLTLRQTLAHLLYHAKSRLNTQCAWGSLPSPNKEIEQPSVGLASLTQLRIYIYYVCLGCLWETHKKKLYAIMSGWNYVVQTCTCSKSVLGV